MTSKELYDALIRKTDLHSVPHLNGNVLTWYLFKDAYVRACADSNDTYIEIVGFSGYMLRWRPAACCILNDLYTLGKQGNVAVLKKSLLATELLYMGPADQCPTSYKNEWFMGKKKWDWGKLLYLEQS